MVEDMENKIRNTLSEIYFSKTKDIVNSLRSVQPLAESLQQQALKQDLAAALQRRQHKTDNWSTEICKIIEYYYYEDEWFFKKMYYGFILFSDMIFYMHIIFFSNYVLFIV